MRRHNLAAMSSHKTYARKKPIFLLFCFEGGLTAKCSQQTFPCCSNSSSSNSFPVPSAISSKIEA